MQEDDEIIAEEVNNVNAEFYHVFESLSIEMMDKLWKEENIGPVILINKLTIIPGEVDQLLRGLWAADAANFKNQSGFISTQLHRRIGGSCVFVNYAVWETTEL